MIKLRKPSDGQPSVICLDGPQGNAYFLLGAASGLMRELKYDENRRTKILDEMQSSNYKNLVCVFEREFGNLIILETTDKDLVKYIAEKNYAGE